MMVRLRVLMTRAARASLAVMVGFVMLRLAVRTVLERCVVRMMAAAGSARQQDLAKTALMAATAVVLTSAASHAER